ncbi:hypothetical protein JHK85_015844 [Glycine max]|nr:hypothetical protein JHK87_015389 [Glycine soja]KAG5031862.1 hypothetical protein JHK85_015844 [Glycine max]
MWNHRNKWVFFLGKTFDKDELKQQFLFTAWSWLNSHHTNFVYSFLQWSINPWQCLPERR